MKKIVLFLAFINICTLYGSAYDDIQQPNNYTKDELEIYNALLNSDMSPKEVGAIIQANKRHSAMSQNSLTNVSASPSYTSLNQINKSSTQNPISLPDPKKDKDAFRKRMAALANNKVFGNLGK